MRVLALMLPLTAVALAACATEQHASIPSAPSFSTPSTSLSTSYASRDYPSSVSRVQVSADLVVRPDTVCVPIALHASAADPAAAMALVEREAEALRTSTGASLRIDDIDARSDRVGHGSEERVESKVVVRGVLEVALGDDDAWARAKQVAALHRAAVERATPATGAKAAPKEGEPVVHVSVGNPEPGVKDVEQHRPKLLASWSERARAIASAATFEGATVELLGCVPPAQVQVVGGTLEKVGLTLPVQCTFQVVRR